MIINNKAKTGICRTMEISGQIIEHVTTSRLEIPIRQALPQAAPDLAQEWSALLRTEGVKETDLTPKGLTSFNIYFRTTTPWD